MSPSRKRKVSMGERGALALASLLRGGRFACRTADRDAVKSDSHALEEFQQLKASTTTSMETSDSHFVARNNTELALIDQDLGVHPGSVFVIQVRAVVKGTSTLLRVRKLLFRSRREPQRANCAEKSVKIT